MIAEGSKILRMQNRNAVRKKEKNANRKTSEANGCVKSDRNISNRKCSFDTAEAEMEDRYETAAETLKVYKRYLPGILKDLSEMEDPRNPRKVEHKLSLLMLYGIFMFVFHMMSMRNANREMTAVFMENMREFFPELDSLPHSFTLSRVLEVIDVESIEAAAMELVNRLIRDKKFKDYMVGNRYLIAIDGVHKFTREWEWCKNSLRKHKKGQPEGVDQYYVYALEASLILPGGLTIPFMTEFMDREKYKDKGVDTDKRKQDCELKSFKRLAARLKNYFPKLKITVTLDGLYANGPLMEICREYNWDYMVVLKDGSLKTVWEDIEKLRETDKVEKYTAPVREGITVKQEFWWLNGIDYRYGENHCNAIKINVVVCNEEWTETDRDSGLEVLKTKKFAWISFKEINARNVENRCNHMGRPRWNIETQNLVEKYHGYAYTHCFSLKWQVMKGFHYLMHLGHILNVLTLYSSGLIGKVKEKGARGAVELIWLAFKGSILDVERLKTMIQGKYQIRMAV